MKTIAQFASETGTAGSDLDAGMVRGILSPIVWAWYDAHQDDRIKISLWGLRPSVRVSALRPLLVAMFGEP